MLMARLCALLPSGLERFAIVIHPALLVILIYALVLAGPVYDLVTRRRVHRAYVLGCSSSVATGPRLPWDDTELASRDARAWRTLLRPGFGVPEVRAFPKGYAIISVSAARLPPSYRERGSEAFRPLFGRTLPRG
jgi:hypothetical protein